MPAGRPREFDIDRALEQVMSVFWAHGYEGTSVADLMEATGLQKGSLYKAFTDKHTLFLSALDRYLALGEARIESLLRDGPPADALAGWLLDVVVPQCTKRGPTSGCFAINCAVELAPHDPEVRKRVRRHFRRIEAALADTVRRAQEDGAIATDEPADEIAEYLLVLVAGLNADGKAERCAERARRVVERALASVVVPRAQRLT